MHVTPHKVSSYGNSAYPALYCHQIHMLTAHLTGEPKARKSTTPPKTTLNSQRGTYFAQQQRQEDILLSAAGQAVLLWIFSAAQTHHSGGLHPSGKGRYRSPFLASVPGSKNNNLKKYYMPLNTFYILELNPLGQKTTDIPVQILPDFPLMDISKCTEKTDKQTELDSCWKLAPAACSLITFNIFKEK